MNMMIKKILLTLSLCSSSYTFADCTVSSNAVISLGTLSSIAFSENGLARTQFNSGLACNSFSVALIDITYIKYRAEQFSTVLTNSVNNDSLSVIFRDKNGNVIQQGLDVDLSSLTILSLFSGPSNSIPFTVEASSGQVVSPGTYTLTLPFRVTWYYSVPALAILGLGAFYESPGFQRPGLISSINWGSGKSSTTTLKLTIDSDCRITTNDVNFGTAAFSTDFQPVNTSLDIRCSSKTPYSVGLSNGENYAVNAQRAMKSGNNYLQYELYKNTSQYRWGSAGAERWSSAEASSNAGIYNGTTQQVYNFSSIILGTNTTTLPAGVYTDNVTVDVTF